VKERANLIKLALSFLGKACSGSPYICWKVTKERTAIRCWFRGYEAERAIGLKKDRFGGRMLDSTTAFSDCMFDLRLKILRLQPIDSAIFLR
jgi:hypothetical protein